MTYFSVIGCSFVINIHEVCRVALSLKFSCSSENVFGKEATEP